MLSYATIKNTGGGYASYVTCGQYEEAYWQGEAAKLLGIEHRAMTVENFTALAERRHPFTGEQIKPKHKQTVTLWDLTVGAPKSASLLALYDPRIREAHQQAALSVPSIEQSLVPSKNLLYTQVHHYESRKLDPHMHTHTLILNLTFDKESERWKCLDHNFMNWYAQKELTEGYRGRYAQTLEDLGYRIADKPQYGFEIEGVSTDLLRKYSQRSQDIEKHTNYRYYERPLADRPPKQLYAETYETYVIQQKEKLTQAERVTLHRMAERAYEHSHKPGYQIAYGEEQSQSQRLTY